MLNMLIKRAGSMIADSVVVDKRAALTMMLSSRIPIRREVLANDATARSSCSVASSARCSVLVFCL